MGQLGSSFKIMSYLGAITNSSLLSITNGIDLKATGQTALYTVPTGYNCIISDIFAIVTTASGIVAAPIFRIGKSPNYNEWLALTTFTGFSAINQAASLNTSANLAVRQYFVSGDVVKIDVQTAATATSMVASLHMLGYLF